MFMKKFMARSFVAALSFGAIALLPACGCGCKKEEHVVHHTTATEPSKGIDAQEANVTALPAEAAPVAVAEEAAAVDAAHSAEHDVK
jgi:hypothetical protein